MAHIGIDVRLPFYQRGGISQYTMHLIPALANIDQNNQYTLMHLWKDQDSYLPSSAQNFRRHNVYTPCHHRIERWALAIETLTIRPHLDILHSPDFIPPQFGAKRRVITVHDLNFIHFPQFLTADSLRYYRDQIKWAAEVADHISADSHHTREDLIEILHIPAEKVTTVHLSVNAAYQASYPEIEIEQTLAEYNLPHGFILAVGTLEPRKNLPLLINAYYQIKQNYDIDIPLVFVGGKGWLYSEIFDTISRLGLESSVVHLQGVSNKKLAHLYHAAGVLATPSHYEGFGLPALEALNCGCPVVVSDRGSLPEVAGDAGIILPADDVDIWAEHLARALLDSEQRQQMIQRGYQHAQTFSWHTAAEQTAAIYRNLLSS